jgi:hypothetical protein
LEQLNYREKFEDESIDSWELARRTALWNGKKRRKYEEARIDVYPLWLQLGESAEVTFLDSSTEICSLHLVVRPNGKPMSKMCAGKEEGCKYCHRGNPPRLRAVLCVVDHREVNYTTQAGIAVVEQHVVRYVDHSIRVAQQMAKSGILTPRDEGELPVGRITKGGAHGQPVWTFESIERDAGRHRVPEGVVKLSCHVMIPLAERIAGLEMQDRCAERN